MFVYIRLLWLHFGDSMGQEARVDMVDHLRALAIIQEMDHGHLDYNAW